MANHCSAPNTSLVTVTSSARARLVPSSAVAIKGVSSLLTLETDPPNMLTDEGHGRLSHMTDNIVFLDIRSQEGIVGRTLRIAKARGIAHDLQVRELEIGARGLRVVKDSR